MDMTTIVIIAFFAVAVIVAIAVGIWFYTRNRRTKQLRSKFGPEYNRVARAEGDAAHAEKILQERQARVKKLEIKPLTDQQRSGFADEWEHTQAQFVDDPTAAVARADVLVQEVMNVRGYPVADFDQRVADISVDHAQVVEHYRAGHEISLRHSQGHASTEDMRQAMIHYRALFDDLLGLTPAEKR